MSNDLINVGNAAISPAMQKYLAERGGLTQSELGAGVTAGFAVVGYRGKVWNIKHRGEETIQVRSDDGTPKAAMDFVIVKAAANISKIFYIDGWVEGSSAPPDCWSVDGVRPDPASPKKQCTNCAGCPMNQWGSAITPAGKKAKRCTDSKRLAVVPVDDIENARYGGPMLLRVPAASLADMANYDGNLMSKGFPYFAVHTSITFDMNESYPKFVFIARRALNDEEAVKVLAMRDGDQVARILSAPVEEVTADVASPSAEPANQSLSQRAAAVDPAKAEADRQAAVKAAQEAAKEAAKAAAKPDDMEARIRAEVEQRIKAEAEEAARQAAAKAAAEKAAAEKAAAEEVARRAAATAQISAEDRLRAEIEARVRAEMAAKAASGGAQGGSEQGAATTLAAANDQPSTASQTAPDVVDAEYTEMQSGDPAPQEFENLLDKLLNE